MPRSKVKRIIDARRVWGARWAEVFEQIKASHHGKMTFEQDQIARRLSTLTVNLEKQDVKYADSEQELPASYGLDADRVRRLTAELNGVAPAPAPEPPKRKRGRPTKEEKDQEAYARYVADFRPGVYQKEPMSFEEFLEDPFELPRSEWRLPTTPPPTPRYVSEVSTAPVAQSNDDDQAPLNKEEGEGDSGMQAFYAATLTTRGGRGQ